MYVTNRYKRCIMINGDLPRTGSPSKSCKRHPAWRFVKSPTGSSTQMIRNVLVGRLVGLTSSILTFGVYAFSQGLSVEREREIASESGGGMWYPTALLGLACLGGAIFLWKRSKKTKNKIEPSYHNRYANYYSGQTSHDDESVDAEKELEWLRRATKSTQKQTQTKDLGSNGKKVAQPTESETKGFQERMRQLQYSQLPINSFHQLAPAKGYAALAESNDPALVAAVEQASDEYEEDESVRDLALRVLAAFKSRNAVSALSQMALYDLSANLRSKAVAALAEFDHESVFETILLACADPTREVRAAAARGLFSLGFDRAHAWKRLIEANDSFRLTSAARAAVESGIVDRSLDRLIHEDSKVAYEAFALVALLIKAGETSEIFNAIEKHKDERVRFAILHVLKVQRDERTTEELTRLALSMSKQPEMLAKIKETISAIQAAVQHEAWQTS